MAQIRDTIDPRDKPLFEAIKAIPMTKRLRVSVKDLPFSVRVRNCFRHAGIKTLGDIVKHSESDLLLIKNFGRDCLRQVKAYCDGVGLTTGMSPDLMVAMEEVLEQKKEQPEVKKAAGKSENPEQLSFPSIWNYTSPKWNVKPSITSSVGPVTVKFSESSRERETLQSILDDIKRMTAKIEEVLS